MHPISNLYQCETIHLNDKFGILDKFESKIIKRNALSESCLNAQDSSAYTLSEPMDYPKQ